MILSAFYGSHLLWLLLAHTVEAAFLANQTDLNRRLDRPIVQIDFPGEFSRSENRESSEREVLVKEDPTDVEEFATVGDQLYPSNNYPNNNYPNNNYPNNNFPGNNYPNEYNPLVPPGEFIPTGSSGLEAFTARKAVDLELAPGRRIKFLDTVTRLGLGWNPNTSEFVCSTPGIFFFTFSACGERFRHFRITLKHNEIGVVSAYGDLNGYQMASNSALLRLLPGDRVYLQLDEGGIYEVTTLTGRAYNTFSGFRIL